MPTKISPLNQTCLMLAFLLMTSFIVVESLQAQDTSVQPSAQRTDKMTPQQKSDLTAIVGIQAVMGDGVGKRLQGIVPDVDTEQISHGLLADMILAQEQKSTVETVPLVEPASRPAKTGNVLDPHMIQTVLRSTAKDLEKLAGQLEQVQFYDKADELRKTATSYWLQARELD